MCDEHEQVVMRRADMPVASRIKPDIAAGGRRSEEAPSLAVRINSVRGLRMARAS
jgi:hypothetical protein